MFDMEDSDYTEVGDLEEADGAVGSGIFDNAGQNTVHTDMGVFADHPALPAYIANNPPFRPFEGGRGIEMEVPTGGAAYIDIPNRHAVPMMPSVEREALPQSYEPTAILPNTWEDPVGQTAAVAPSDGLLPLPNSAAWTTPMPLAPLPPPVSGLRSLRGLGTVDGMPTWPQIAFVGLLLGVGIGLVHNTIQARQSLTPNRRR